MSKAVPEKLFSPLEGAINRRGIGIYQELGGVAAKPLSGRPRAVNSQAVTLARADIGQQAVPDMSRTLWKLEALFVAGVVEEAHLYGVGNVRRHCEIGAPGDRRCPEREIETSLYIHPLTVPRPR
jgi:hypothetical protein